MTPALTETQARRAAEKAWSRFDRYGRIVDPENTSLSDWLFVVTVGGWRVTLTEHFGRWLASEPVGD